MARPEPRTLEVLKTGFVTRNMFRVTVGGDGLKGFPVGQTGGYVKLRIPAGNDSKPFVRTYTIRYQSEDALDIDFALHGDGTVSGPATSWAVAAKPGDTVSVGGPGPAKPLPAPDGSFLLAGDMTALPAISVNLESLGPDARGHAVIEIQNAEDRQDIAVPPSLKLHWLVNPQPGRAPDLLSDYVRTLPWSDDLTYAWVACEFESMRRLRTYLRDERRLGPDRLYVSSYWKYGLGEDEHRTIKRADAESSL